MPEETLPTAQEKPKPALNLRFISHGTLEVVDIDKTRKFYEEFLGFETVRASKASLWVRLGGEHIYVVVKVLKKEPMPFLNHNGVDVMTDEEVDEAHKITLRDAEQWGLHGITKPSLQHGTYSFYFYDADDNCWEILSNPKGGYSWMFERGDQEGLGHLKKSFERPQLD
nr:VOC family protein [Sphingomonas sp. CDS-1]